MPAQQRPQTPANEHAKRINSKTCDIWNGTTTRAAVPSNGRTTLHRLSSERNETRLIASRAKEKRCHANSLFCASCCQALLDSSSIAQQPSVRGSACATLQQKNDHLHHDCCCLLLAKHLASRLAAR